MMRILRSRMLKFGFGVVAATAAAMVLVPGMVGAIFSPGYFMPHSHCYLNDPRMIALQGISDFLIGVAYMGISAGLAYLVYKARRDIPFEWMFVAFGLFIFTCGWTHFLEVWTLWYPSYWLSGTVKAITATASVATALGISPLLPRIFRLIETARASEKRKRDLEQAHREMETMNRQLRTLDELKSQFFANVSHELRTPLALILGNVERLLYRGKLDTTQQNEVHAIQRNGQSLLKQVNNLLDASKLEAGKMEIQYVETDLAELVRLACANFQSIAQDRGIQLQVNTPDSLPAQVDPEKVERILINLLSNAFKFVPMAGVVRCELRQEDAMASLEVSDNGPGIAPEQREMVFERFRQLEGGSNRRYGGTGLGLSIAKQFVELHQGRITVDESPEGGARFVVKLPLRAPADQPVQRAVPVSPVAKIEAAAARAELTPEPQVSPGEPVARKGTEPVVLIVEDNPEMARLIQTHLTPDYLTVTAADGGEGLAKARTVHPDLVLTDIMMPRVSGDQLVRELRADRAFDAVPIVVLTARADEQVRVQLLREGAQDYLLKPFTAEEMHARVGNLITARRYRQELERANQELQAFSYSLAHDLRAPLRSIKSFAQIIIEDHGPRLGPEAGAFLRKIVNAGNRLDLLVADVLNYTRMAASPMELHSIDLESFLSGIIHERAEFQPPQAEIQIGSPLPPVMGDEASLTQCVTNLLSNAVKFVAPGTKPQVKIWSERTETHVRVWFQDNGVGIDPKDRDRLFRLFQRLHGPQYEGTGLGLAIVRKAVERMGGLIGVESEVGQGSRFWIELRAG